MGAADLYPSLRDRVVAMTGGGRGLGLEMALALVEAGARVTVTSAREAGELADVMARAEARAGPGRLIAVQADVRDYEDCLKVRERTLDAFGAVHCLVNNAGRGMKLVHPNYVEERPKFWEAPLDGWREIVDTNINGVFNMARAFTPGFIEQGCHSAWNIDPLSGVIGVQN